MNCGKIYKSHPSTAERLPSVAFRVSGTTQQSMVILENGLRWPSIKYIIQIKSTKHHDKNHIPVTVLYHKIGTQQFKTYKILNLNSKIIN